MTKKRGKKPKARKQDKNTASPETAYPSQLVRTGMTEEHESIFQKFSVANEVISIWRPINEEAADRLSHGYIGKAIFTKGKSSAFGTIAADIPVDVRLSKIADQRYNKNKNEEREKQIEYFQKINNMALQESNKMYERWKGKITSDIANTFNDLYMNLKINPLANISSH